MRIVVQFQAGFPGDKCFTIISEVACKNLEDVDT